MIGLSDKVTTSEEKEIEEKRIRPTVIRRRAKIVETPPEEIAVTEEVPVAEDVTAPESVKEKQEAISKEVSEKIEPQGEATSEEKEAKPEVEQIQEPPAPEEPAEKAADYLKGKKEGKVTVEIEDEKRPAKKKRTLQDRKREVVTKRSFMPRGGETRFEPALKKKRKGQKTAGKKTEITTPKAIKRVIKISEVITVGDLAKRVGIKSSEIIKKLIGLGMMSTVNQSLDIDTATLIANEFGFEIESVALEMDMILQNEEVKEEDLKPRPPVVTIMGHVDHGKTTLLDGIRKTDVTAGESGGITQHIGAYDVKLDNGDVVFLDTPGHEAFTAMRSRGAKVTDIVVLVVAADDGVMPQTIEAIDHAKAADVPIIVAVNKIDKPEANQERIKQELSKYELIPEDWGGSTIFVEVSAKERTGLKELLEVILLQAEIMELKASPKAFARGTIVEAQLDKGRGPVATVLVQSGTLRVGDNFVSGKHAGKVRGLNDDKGKKVKEAGPSIPVEVIGLSGVPEAGDDFVVLAEERLTKQISLQRSGKSRDTELAKSSKVTLDQLFSRIQEGDFNELNIILKSDVHGSIEAITESLHKLSTDQVKLKVIHSAVGGINESDVLLASASNAIIIGFHVRPEIKASKLAETEKVDIKTYSIIYDVVNDVRAAMEGLLSPVVKEVYLGRAEIRETFAVSKVGTIAGCYVIDGKIVRNAEVRVLRDNVVIFEGKLSSLKRFADDAKEVQSGYECGMGIENFNDIKVGDVIEAFTHEEEAAKL
ncbi:MAG: translation initiation factor IF-2 [Proteobacteria bacterium]|nr:translation initiation factor IF-2 [Pseudomonadota bacterium]